MFPVWSNLTIQKKQKTQQQQQQQKKNKLEIL